MTKRILDLQTKRAGIIEAMEGLINDGKLEDWEARKAELEPIEKEIKALEAQEEFNRSLAGQGNDGGEAQEREKMLKRFDLSKAIGEISRGLTGVEAEINDEGHAELRGFEVASNSLIIPSKFLSKRATETKVTGADHIAEEVGGLDIITAPSMLDIVGVTQMEGLTANIKLPFSSGHDASFVDEGNTATESAPTNSKGDLTARGVQGWKAYSAEYLAQSTVMPQMLADMVESLDRAIWQEVCNSIAIDGLAVTGKASADVGAAPTYKDILGLMAEVEGDTFRKEGYVMSKALYHNLQGVTKDSGSGRFVIENKAINGVRSFGTSALAPASSKHQIVYGDFSRAYVGKFGGIQLIVDPYTAKKTREVEISFSRLADVTINPSAFKAILNASLA